MSEHADQLADLLALRPHPEGGRYAETYRSAWTVSPRDGRPPRPALTQIYYLLVRGEHSRWHRVRSDEAWHHYEGDGLELLLLSPEGDLQRQVLGPAAPGAGGARPHHTVPAGWWQAARPLGDHALVGCTVAPGFDFADFAFMGAAPEVAALVRARFPELADLI